MFLQKYKANDIEWGNENTCINILISTDMMSTLSKHFTNKNTINLISLFMVYIP